VTEIKSIVVGKFNGLSVGKISFFADIGKFLKMSENKK